MRRESSIERAACRLAKAKLGVESAKFEPPGSDGWPDRVFFVPGGRPIFVEFKRPGEKLRPLQVHRREQLRGWGYDVETHETVEGAVEAVERALRRARQ